MRTTITLDDKLLAAAVDYAGVKERSTVMRMALEEFVQRRAELRLKELRGSMPDFGKGATKSRRPTGEASKSYSRNQRKSLAALPLSVALPRT